MKKIKALRKTLEPIESEIGLEEGAWIRNYFTEYDDDLYWWEKVEKIAGKLIDTYNGNPDEGQRVLSFSLNVVF